MFAASLLAQETASLLAQETSTIPEAGGGAILVWLLLALGIVGLYVLISRTRRRSYRDFLSRADREAELRANDPDMKATEDQQHMTDDDDRRPTTDDRRPTTDDRRPTTDDR